jgi:hypothetical protein
MRCAHARGIVLFAIRRADDGHGGPNCRPQSDSHMPKTAEANYRESRARSSAPSAEWRVSRNAGAEERCRSVQWESIRYTQYKILIHCDLCRVSPLSNGSISINPAVGQDEVWTKLLLAAFAALALPARIHQTADANAVPWFEAGYIRSDFIYNPGDLMARNERILAHTKIILHKVKIGMADTAIVDFDCHIGRTWIPSFELIWPQRRGSVECGITLSRNHKHSPRRILQTSTGMTGILALRIPCRESFRALQAEAYSTGKWDGEVAISPVEWNLHPDSRKIRPAVNGARRRR